MMRWKDSPHVEPNGQTCNHMTEGTIDLLGSEVSVFQPSVFLLQLTWYTHSFQLMA